MKRKSSFASQSSATNKTTLSSKKSSQWQSQLNTRPQSSVKTLPPTGAKAAGKKSKTSRAAPLRSNHNQPAKKASANGHLSKEEILYGRTPSAYDCSTSMLIEELQR